MATSSPILEATSAPRTAIASALLYAPFALSMPSPTAPLTLAIPSPTPPRTVFIASRPVLPATSIAPGTPLTKSFTPVPASDAIPAAARTAELRRMASNVLPDFCAAIKACRFVNSSIFLACNCNCI